VQHAFWSAYYETTCGLKYSRTVNQATSPVACPNGRPVTKNISEQKTEERENGAPNPELARCKPKKVCGVGCHRDANGQAIELKRPRSPLGSKVNQQR
jgi:hypothetical protein